MTPSGRAESIATGPPSNRHTGALTSPAQSGRTSSTSDSSGRLTMTPSAPSPSWSRMNTTLRKNGPALDGWRRDQQPASQRVHASMMPTWPTSRAVPEEFTVDELAARAQMTVRNVRAYAGRGLIDAPRLEGRTGYYTLEHLQRLQLIRQLIDRGYTLAAVERAVTGRRVRRPATPST